LFARMLRSLRTLRRFGRAREGTAAVEFALVALPFFLLTVGMAEISMMGFAQTSLDYAVSESARQIRTGQAQTGGLDGQDIEDQICANVNRFMFLDCDANLFLDVDRFDSFVDINNEEANPIEDDEFQEDGFGYNPGGESDIVVVRVYYRWHVMTPMFEPIFRNVSSGDRILVTTMMFRNEPF
jgi:Flp pilus assembly protein TadG